MVVGGPRAMGFLTTVPFAELAPSWSRGLRPQPSSKICLGMLTTPVHAFRPPCLDAAGFASIEIKRDDMSGGPELGGNKVRKLEFLLADAKAQGADVVVTIGGIQSNHARATAVAARLVGLDSSLILRVSDRAADDEIGFAGNLMFERLVHARIRTVTKRQYAQLGSAELLRREAEALRAEGRRPYVIGVGGSNALGAWGYMSAVQELLEQLGDRPAPEHIVFACGSGGTACGLALGVLLSGMRGTKLHAIAVCDTPEYFYEHVAATAAQLGFSAEGAEARLESVLTVHQGKGTGYGLATPDELRTIAQTAAATGIVLDSTYSGKALHAFSQYAREHPAEFAGSSLLFWHTGGVLGMAGAGADAFAPLMPADQVGKLVHDS